MRDLTLYPCEVRPLTKEEGGGYLISFPDFSECISDGETPEEAIRNGMDALAETVAALEDMGLPVPAPGSGGAFSGKFIQRVPRSLHARLAARAPGGRQHERIGHDVFG
jgi:antitoxin HicB